ncbi:hypothetical protein [Heyndrickxia acidiproducens]|uniref:hypothetical protein n=1 Tax=Heyndrickxia acidiproducens TaxID=1121084 RepID=UPI001F3DD19F|nr:hypothetical protein [Heyndrickxia acidiproducens]
MICGFILLFVPLFFFLREGIHHIYQHYSMVIPHTKNMVLLVAALFMAFIGMLSVHVFLWQVLCSIKQNYRNSTIRLSLLCFSGVPLSIMLYTVYLMSKFRISTFTGLGHAIFSFPPPFIRSMIIIVWLFSIMNTVMFSVYALAVMLAFLFERKAMLQKRKNFFITLLLIVSLCVLVQFGIGSNVKYLWKIYFLYYVAISLPFYALLVGKKKRTILLPFSVLVVAICGGATGILLRNFYAALAVTAVGAFIVGLAVMLTRKSKDLIK